LSFGIVKNGISQLYCDLSFSQISFLRLEKWHLTKCIFYVNNHWINMNNHIKNRFYGRICIISTLMEYLSFRSILCKWIHYIEIVTFCILIRYTQTRHSVSMQLYRSQINAFVFSLSIMLSFNGGDTAV